MTRAFKNKLISFALGLVAGGVVILVLLFTSVLDQGDRLSMSVSPQRGHVGETVEVILSRAAEEQGANPGTIFLQARGSEGQWRTRFLLSTGGFAGPHDPPDVIRANEPLVDIGIEPQGEERIFRIPRVRPGRYRLAHVLWREGEERGFGAMPSRFQPKLVAAVRVVR